MTIYCGVYPAHDQPIKSQIENMLEVALRREEFRNFWGTIKHRATSLQALRKLLPEIWGHMTVMEKRAFLWPYFNSARLYLREIIDSLGETGLKTMTALDGLEEIDRLQAWDDKSEMPEFARAMGLVIKEPKKAIGSG